LAKGRASGGYERGEPHFQKRDLTRARGGCSISGSEGIGVNVAGSRSQCSSSVQHLGNGARMMVFPFDEKHRAAWCCRRAGQSRSAGVRRRFSVW